MQLSRSRRTCLDLSIYLDKLLSEMSSETVQQQEQVSLQGTMANQQKDTGINYDIERTRPGQGARTHDYYRTSNIPGRFDNPDSFEGYNSKSQHPMYMTSAMEYGSRKPTVHTMPTSFHAKCQKFSEHLGQCGMYRNYSLNTSSDKSIV